MRFALLLSAVALAAGGQARAATRAFPVAGFDKIRNATPFDVRVHVGGAPGARAEGTQEVLDRLELTVRDGQLTVGTARGSWWSGWSSSRGHAVIDVSVPTLVAAGVTGPGNMNVDRARGPAFIAGVSGPGALTIGLLEARDATLAVSGPGDLMVTGRAQTALVALSGPGNIKARGFATRDATVTLSGPGNIDVGVSGSAAVNLSGPGDVRIAGHPRCTVRRSGPGSVSCG